MTVQLVAFEENLSRIKRRNIVREIILGSKADLILFPGTTLDNEQDLKWLCAHIQDTSVTSVLELKEAQYHFCTQYHALRWLKGSCDYDYHTGQCFSTSYEAAHDYMLMSDFILYQLPKRQFPVRHKNTLTLQCGENNTITTPRNGKPRFRFENDPHLNPQYEQIMRNADIILNPMHTLQHRHFSERCAHLSLGRYYFGTANAGDGVPLCNRLLVAYHNGKPLPPDNVVMYKGKYCYGMYTIDD